MLYLVQVLSVSLKRSPYLNNSEKKGRIFEYEENDWDSKWMPKH